MFCITGYYATQGLFGASQKASAKKDTYFHSGVVIMYNWSAPIRLNVFFKQAKPQVHFLLFDTVHDDRVKADTCRGQRSQVQAGKVSPRLRFLSLSSVVNH